MIAINKKIKDKKGITASLTCVFLAFMIALLVYIIDGGRGYLYKVELQQIADSMSLGASRYGIRVYENPYDGAKINAVIEESKAKQKANDLMDKNMNQNDNVSLKNVSVRYNFEGNISGQLKKTLYDAGVFNVELSGSYKGLINGKWHTISVNSATKINPKGNNVNKANVKIINNHILVYDSNGVKILDKSLE